MKVSNKNRQKLFVKKIIKILDKEVEKNISINILKKLSIFRSLAVNKMKKI